MHAVYQAPSGLGRAPSLPPGAGRVGEKRVRGYDDERKRRSGLIVPERGEEEDIFGPRSRASSVRPSREGGGMRAPSVARSIAASTTADDERPSKKPKPDSKQAVDNKGVSYLMVVEADTRRYARLRCTCLRSEGMRATTPYTRRSGLSRTRARTLPL